MEAYKEWLINETQNGVPILELKKDFDRWKNLYSKTILPYSPKRRYKYDIEYSPNTFQKVFKFIG